MFLLESWAVSCGLRMVISGADCGLLMEIWGCGWSWIKEGKGKYLAVAGAGGWISIDKGKGKYLVVAGACGWSLKLDQRRKDKGKYLGGNAFVW